MAAAMVGFFFYSCQFIKSFRPFHLFWEGEDLSRRSKQAFQNDTIESIHFTDAWSQTKEVIPVVFPIQSI